jgi:hypothetical protein
MKLYQPANQDSQVMGGKDERLPRAASRITHLAAQLETVSTVTIVKTVHMD